MFTCQHCFMNNETKHCDSLTCRRHVEYWRWRRDQQMTMPAIAPVLEAVVTCQLHVGFICIEETEEMLEALRKPDQEAPPNGLATPKISSSNHFITPINRTAAAVAAWINLLRLPKP